MHWIYEFFRLSHILAGVLALVIAPVAMIVRKGGVNHRRWGKVYYWSMAWIFVSTAALVLFRPNIFLLAVGVLSFYQAFSGERVLRMKRPERDRPQAIDWAGASVAVASGAAVILWGAGLALGLIGGEQPGDLALAFSALGIFFGLAVIQAGIADMRRFRAPPGEPRAWWYHHMSGMLGSYVGAVTAFMVQTVSRWMYNVEALAPYAWVVWVLPAAVGSPLIALWIASYRRKFSATAASARAESY
jgi:hypothetical protein